MHLAATALITCLLATPALAQERTQYVLAISWHNAFCETAGDRPDCGDRDQSFFDASNFSLHGLWPQPRSRDYCGVDTQTVLDDDAGDWDRLPEVALSTELRIALDETMPGVLAGLDRHEWIKHGTCYGTDAEEYFADSLAMLRAVNDSAVRELFSRSVGSQVTQAQVRAAFDESSGDGAGERVRLACRDDGNRRLIVELTIGLTGDIEDAADFADRIMDARATDGGCDAGIVDAVGAQ